MKPKSIYLPIIIITSVIILLLVINLFLLFKNMIAIENTLIFVLSTQTIFLASIILLFTLFTKWNKSYHKIIEKEKEVEAKFLNTSKELEHEKIKVDLNKIEVITKILDRYLEKFREEISMVESIKIITVKVEVVKELLEKRTDTNDNHIEGINTVSKKIEEIKELLEKIIEYCKDLHKTEIDKIHSIIDKLINKI